MSEYQDTTQANREREFQRMATEANPQKGENEYEAWFSNQKLTYDNFLEILAAQARRGQTHYDTLMVGEREHSAELKRVSLQALQNSVETANMVGKQAVRHTDIAIDRQWNREPAEAAAETTELREVLNEPAIHAISAAVVKAVADALSNIAPK